MIRAKSHTNKNSRIIVSSELFIFFLIIDFVSYLVLEEMSTCHAIITSKNGGKNGGTVLGGGGGHGMGGGGGGGGIGFLQYEWLV